MPLKDKLKEAIKQYFTEHNDHLPADFWDRALGRRTLSGREQLWFFSGCKGAQIAISFYNFIDSCTDEEKLKEEMIKALCDETGSLSKFASRPSTHLRAAILTCLVSEIPKKADDSKYTLRDFIADYKAAISGMEADRSTSRSMARSAACAGFGYGGVVVANEASKETRAFEVAKAKKMGELLTDKLITPVATPAPTR